MKKKLIVKQEEASDCGVCALLSIIRYYGSNASLENLRMFSLTNHTGVTALNLINCAKRYGFDAKGLKIDSFDNIKLPVIAHVNINKSLSHFIVIYEIKDTCFDIMDPAYGHKTISKEYFNEIFSGNIIVLCPKVLIYENNDKKVMFKKLINIYKYKTKYLILILIFYLFILPFSLIYDLFLNISLISNFGIKIFFIFTFILLFKEILNYYILNNENNLIKRCSNELLQDFFIHIFKLPLKYIHLKDPGEIIKRTNELESISEFYVEFFLNITSNLLLIIPIFYILFSLNLLSFVLTIICSLLYLLYVIFSNRNIKEHIDSTITTSTDYSMIVNNYLCRLTSIKHVNNTSFFLNSVNKKRDEYFKQDLKLKKYLLKNNAIKKFIILFFELINMQYLINLYYNSLINIELIIAINTLSISCLSSINSIADGIPNVIYYHKLINRVNDFYNINEDDNDSNRFVGGDVCCKNLSFSYNGVDNTIRDINFKIKNKEKVFIRGISGVGKSTICKILNKDLIDYHGEIKIGGIDLKKLSLKEISNTVGYCSQNEYLFTGTIKENILLGRDISDKRFKDIVRICNLEQVVRHKPFSYDTYLYGSGEELSGGEKNLILLARCLIENKKIYILDESLANVNEETEIYVLKNILSYFKDSTILYISHRDKSNYFERVIDV